jgi:hypothetical protein
VSGIQIPLAHRAGIPSSLELEYNHLDIMLDEDRRSAALTISKECWLPR